jgi:hypothetical protein
LLDKAWKLSAVHWDKPGMMKFVDLCVTLYNDRRKEGKISTEVEDQAIEKVQQAAANRLKKTAIPPECRGKGSSNVDLCALARGYADDLAKQLPVRLSQSLTMTTAFAVGNACSRAASLTVN